VTYGGKSLWHPSLDPPTDRPPTSYSAEYELLRAARWRGYRWEDFDALDVDDQARVVAEYLTENRLAVVQSYEKPRDHGAGSGRRSARRR
jgi:hypothetical protein